MESRDSGLLLVWRVCDQAFGRCMAPEWYRTVVTYVTITKIENLHMPWLPSTEVLGHATAHFEKFTDSQKCYSFRSMTKINEVIAEKPFQNSGVTRRLAVSN